MCMEGTPMCTPPVKRDCNISEDAMVHGDGNKCSALGTTVRKSPMEVFCSALEIFAKMLCYWLPTGDLLKLWLHNKALS